MKEFDGRCWEEDLHDVATMYIMGNWTDGNWEIPILDEKRPFGNSDIAGDVLEELSFEREPDEGWTEEQRQYVRQLLKAVPAHIQQEWRINCLK